MDPSFYSTALSAVTKPLYTTRVPYTYSGRLMSVDSASIRGINLRMDIIFHHLMKPFLKAIVNSQPLWWLSQTLKCEPTCDNLNHDLNTHTMGGGGSCRDITVCLSHQKTQTLLFQEHKKLTLILTLIWKEALLPVLLLLKSTNQSYIHRTPFASLISKYSLLWHS